jgi:hypothetical protein
MPLAKSYSNPRKAEVIDRCQICKQLGVLYQWDQVLLCLNCLPGFAHFIMTRGIDPIDGLMIAEKSFSKLQMDRVRGTQDGKTKSHT